MIEGKSGVIVYGEVDPASIFVEVGQEILAGYTIGRIVVPVLKHFKGRPTIMLHLELMEHGCRDALWWTDISTCPDGLLDPTPHLKNAAPNAPVFDLSGYDGATFMDSDAPRKDSRWWRVWGGNP